jgi:hypothetical protein
MNDFLKWLSENYFVTSLDSDACNCCGLPDQFLEYDEVLNLYDKYLESTKPNQ